MSFNFPRAHYPVEPAGLASTSSNTSSDTGYSSRTSLVVNVPSLKNPKPPTRSPSTTDQPRAGRSLRLINAINLVSLSNANIDESSVLDLALLNILFGVGYCSSLAATSFLLSRLYLTSKDACKLAILGAFLTVLAINTLNTCWLRSGLIGWPASLDALNGCEFKNLTNSRTNSLPNSPANFSSFERTSSSPPHIVWCTLLYYVTSLPIALLTTQNVYTAQIAIYSLYGFFQAQLEYSTRLLLIERFSQEKLLRVISLHRFMIGLGHLSLLFVRIILKRLQTNQFVRPICESDDCRAVISSCIVAASSSVAIVLIRFISNRSVRPARNNFTNRGSGNGSTSIKKPGKVVKKASWLAVLVRPFNAFRAFKVFRKLERPEVDRTRGSQFTATNPLKKQLSDSDLKALEILRDLVSQKNLVNSNDCRPPLRRTKSDHQIPETTVSAPTLAPVLDHRSNYLVDCIECGRYFVVDIDPNKAVLVEICLLDDLKVSLILQNGKQI